MAILKAKDFRSRKDLESKIKAEYGDNIQANTESGHTIEGKLEELKKLKLKDTRRVFGVKPVCTDVPTADVVEKNKNKKKPKRK